MKPDDLLTCCGTFCGTCARWREFTAFRQAAALLAEIVDAHGFRHWLPDVVRSFDYAEFRKGLDFFADDSSWLVCRNACREGSGGPPFCVRDCCKGHKADVCWDCPEFPCAQVKDNKQLMEGAAEYRELGREEWGRVRMEAAAKGYELHTGKCYRVTVSCDDKPVA
jgi:hypothetical protein